MVVSINGFPYVTISEAAESIGITASRLRQMLRAEVIKGFKSGPRAWLIPIKEVERLKKTPQTTGRPRVGRD